MLKLIHQPNIRQHWLLGLTVCLSMMMPAGFALAATPPQGDDMVGPMPEEAVVSTDKESTTAQPSDKGKAGSKNQKTQDTESGEKAVDPVTHVDISGLPAKTQRELNEVYQAVQLEARGVNNELRDEEETSAKDLAMLWQGAVERSGSIRYAIEKLSNTDASGQVVKNDALTKKLLQGAARLGGIAGSMVTGSPASMLGGNVVENLLLANPNDSVLTRVSDADMVILATEVESLQTRVLTLYYDYQYSKERLVLAEKYRRRLQQIYKSTPQSQPQNDPENASQQASDTLMNSLVVTAEQDEAEAQQEFANAQRALALVVGTDAMAAFEQVNQTSSALPAGS